MPSFPIDHRTAEAVAILTIRFIVSSISKAHAKSSSMEEREHGSSDFHCLARRQRYRGECPCFITDLGGPRQPVHTGSRAARQRPGRDAMGMAPAPVASLGMASSQMAPVGMASPSLLVVTLRSLTEQTNAPPRRGIFLPASLYRPQPRLCWPSSCHESAKSSPSPSRARPQKSGGRRHLAGRGQPAFEIGEDIVDMLDADRQPHIAVGYARGELLLG